MCGTLFEETNDARKAWPAEPVTKQLLSEVLALGRTARPNFFQVVKLQINGGLSMWRHISNKIRRPVIDLDEEIFESRIARAGERLIRVAMVIKTVEPLLVLTAFVLVIAAGPALAQAPGGNIFGGSDQTVGNGVREAIRWARNVLFLLGIGACAWGAVNIFLEKPYARQFIGGGAAMGFGGIASLAYSFAQGQAVNVDTDVGQ